jgi:hypothetical protein
MPPSSTLQASATTLITCHHHLPCKHQQQHSEHATIIHPASISNNTQNHLPCKHQQQHSEHATIIHPASNSNNTQNTPPSSTLQASATTLGTLPVKITGSVPISISCCLRGPVLIVNPHSAFGQCWNHGSLCCPCPYIHFDNAFRKWSTTPVTSVCALPFDDVL